ncbi:hypothetical protein FOMPIDRAFT_95240 [Fomitopsis schrenkii]|uniref:Uncharacterized protein n=1 Tax=Fomitopsis schrenkii TaxID=2126942 RepID=S8DME8_FOMSC|nr:hypothetical protein FOMPIDRAFT_95240 [Fomitopsis schrenkii]
MPTPLQPPYYLPQDSDYLQSEYGAPHVPQPGYVPHAPQPSYMPHVPQPGYVPLPQPGYAPPDYAPPDYAPPPQLDYTLHAPQPDSTLHAPQPGYVPHMPQPGYAPLPQPGYMPPPQPDYAPLPQPDYAPHASGPMRNECQVSQGRARSAHPYALPTIPTNPGLLPRRESGSRGPSRRLEMMPSSSTARVINSAVNETSIVDAHRSRSRPARMPSGSTMQEAIVPFVPANEASSTLLMLNALSDKEIQDCQEEYGNRLRPMVELYIIMHSAFPTTAELELNIKRMISELTKANIHLKHVGPNKVKFRARNDAVIMKKAKGFASTLRGRFKSVAERLLPIFYETDLAPEPYMDNITAHDLTEADAAALKQTYAGLSVHAGS